jgi:hypothetical protein
MVAWTVHDIKVEVVAVAALLVARVIPDGGSGPAKLAYEKLKSSMTATICNKIQSIRVMEAESALELQVALTETDMPEDSKLTIQEMLDSQLAVASELVQGAVDDPKTQQLHIYPCTYLTQGDWDKLWSDVSLFQTTMVCVQRLRRCGVKSLHEQTVKWWVAVLVVLWTHKINKLPPHKLIHELVKDFKKAFAACPVDLDHTGHSFLKIYPEKVADLPAGFIAKAYTELDLPVSNRRCPLARCRA